MLDYAAEKAAREDLVTIGTANSTPWVTVEGGYKGYNGTNPVCIRLPRAGRLVSWILRCRRSVMQIDSVLAQRLGTELLTHSAFYKHGEATPVPFSVSAAWVAP
jgi:LDH2 family malate/lactate/ureidoglycolate dehydrogenase